MRQKTDVEFQKLYCSDAKVKALRKVGVKNLSAFFRACIDKELEARGIGRQTSTTELPPVKEGDVSVSG